MPLERDVAVLPGEGMARAVEVQVTAMVAQVERANVQGKVTVGQTGIPLLPFCFSSFRSAASATSAIARNSPSY
jgi:hypothetical protein